MWKFYILTPCAHDVHNHDFVSRFENQSQRVSADKPSQSAVGQGHIQRSNIEGNDFELKLKGEDVEKGDVEMGLCLGVHIEAEAVSLQTVVSFV